MSTGPVNETTSTSTTNTCTTEVSPSFGPEAMQAIHARNQRSEGENIILLLQIADIRLLMEQDREAREQDRVSREQEKASLDLLRA